MKVLEQIKQEMEAQNKKWGVQRHSPVEWIAILGEEFGEASKEAVDHHFTKKKKLEQEFEQMQSYQKRLHTDEQKKRLQRYREELIQVAAVAAQMVISLDAQTK